MKLRDEELLEEILTEIKDKCALKTICGSSYDYGDDWYDHGSGGSNDGFGFNSGDHPVSLPGVIVTPHGNYIDYQDWESWYYTSQSGSNHNPDDQGGSGGDDYNGSVDNTSSILSNGMLAMDHITDSISNNSAVYFKHIENTKGFALASATSLADGVPGIQYDLICALKGNQGIINTLGKAMVKGNVVLNGSVAAIGLCDGDITTADLLSGASAVLGTVGLFTTVCPWVALTCDGLSFVLSIAATYAAQQESQNKNY